MWTGSPDALPTARIAMLAPSLQPTERRVAESIVADVEAAIDRTAQELANHVGVGRASVIRTAQTLGYRGYQQLRVALVRELALDGRTAQSTSGEATPVSETTTARGVMASQLERFASRVTRTLEGIENSDLDEFVRVLDESSRVLVIANGLSSPLGLDLTLRLISAGRSAEYLADGLAQQVAATHLEPGCACVVVTGSGSNRASLDVIAEAREREATVLVVTCFPGSPAALAADTALIVAPIEDGFRDELVHTSRAAVMLILESVVSLLVARRRERGRRSQSATLSVVSRSLVE